MNSIVYRGASWLTILALWWLSGCTSPLKVIVTDPGAEPVRSLVVKADFTDIQPPGKLGSDNLTVALQQSLAEYLKEIGQGKIEIVPTNTSQKAGHRLSVTAQMVSYTNRIPGYWDPCAYTDKNKKCVGGMVGDRTDYATARVDAVLTNLTTGQDVMRIDALNSRPLTLGDDSPAIAGRAVAREIGRILKEAKFIG